MRINVLKKMAMSTLKLLRYSNFKISFDINPFTWSFKWITDKRLYPEDPIWMIYCRVFPLSFVVVIDDGKFKVSSHVFGASNG